eukprot:13189639-Alexandrium_andersonii.AAC.1
MQLPELGHDAVPLISTKPEPDYGGIFYRKPGTTRNDFHNYTLEPPEFLKMGRLGKTGEVPEFDASAYGNPGIWNEQRRFLTINNHNRAAYGAP